MKNKGIYFAVGKYSKYGNQPTREAPALGYMVVDGNLLARLNVPEEIAPLIHQITPDDLTRH
jgi:hypothetical protein